MLKSLKFLTFVCAALLGFSPCLSADKTESWPSAFFKGTLIGVPLVAGAVVAVETCQNLGKEKECKDKGTGKVVLRKMSFADAFLESFKTLRKYCVPVGVGCCAASAALTAVFKYSNSSVPGLPGGDLDSDRDWSRYAGKNSSKLFSRAGELSPYFSDAGFLDPVAAIFEIEEGGKKRPLKESELISGSLEKRIKLLNKATHRITGEKFWDLVGLKDEADDLEYQLIKKISNTGIEPSREEVTALFDGKWPGKFRCNFYPANDLCAPGERLTGDPAFPGGGKGSFTVVSEHTIQELMAECPEAFDGSAVQSASRFSTFEAHFDLLRAIHSGSHGLGSYQNGVQGETLGLQFLPGSMLRKYVEEPILAKIYDDPRFKDGIDMDAESCSCANRSSHGCRPCPKADYGADKKLGSVLVGLQKQSRVVFVGDKGKDDRRCKGGSIPALGVAKQKIDCSQLISFAMNTSSAGNDGPIGQRAKELLRIQMLGGVKAAFLDGKRKVFLTCLGLGVFKNNSDWFVEAMGPVLDFAKAKNMDIVLVDFVKDNKDVSDTAKRVLATAERKGFTSSRRALTSLPDIKARFKDLKMMS